jgi:hypothetical protein
MSRTIVSIVSNSERNDFSVCNSSRKISSMGPSLVSECDAGGSPGDRGTVPDVSGLNVSVIAVVIRRGGTGVNGGFESRIFKRSF